MIGKVKSSPCFSNFLPIFKMFLVVRIQKGTETIKPWFGIKAATEIVTLADLFEEYRRSALDHKPPLELEKICIKVYIGQNKTEFSRGSCPMSRKFQVLNG